MKLMGAFRSNSWFFASVGCLIIIPLLFPSLAFINIISEILIMALFAVSLNLLIGYTGLISFGHASFFAVGSYTVGIILQNFSSSLPLAIPLSLLWGMVLSGIIALPIGYFCTRLSSIYFAFLTLAFSQIIYAVIIKWQNLTGGDQGLVGGIPKPPIVLGGLVIDMSSPFALYFLIVVAVCISLLVIKRITDSPFGWILRALRENSARMSFLGIDAKKHQIAVFVISGIFAGLSGGLMALHLSGSYPDHAYWTKSAEPIFMIMLGGLRTFAGPILGALIVTELSVYMCKYTGIWGLGFGSFLVLYLIVIREGILDVFIKWRERRRSAISHKK